MPRFQRRKEDRPAEITDAALATFAEKGYAQTRVSDVAKRAGVSKGLLYLYFKTKEELFKAVIRSFVSPRFEALIESMDQTESAEAFLRGPFLRFAKMLPRSPARILIRLMIAEGPKHPDLVSWYWQTIVSKAIPALGRLIQRGVDNGEFKPSAIQQFPHLLVAPVFFSTVFQMVFQDQAELDSDAMMDAHIETVLSAIKVSDHG